MRQHTNSVSTGAPDFSRWYEAILVGDTSLHSLTPANQVLAISEILEEADRVSLHRLYRAQADEISGSGLFGPERRMYLKEKRAELLADLEREACVDALTGVLNRSQYEAWITNHIIPDEPSRRDFSGVLMVDVNNFKSINDTLGHDKGDSVLKNVALVLQSHTRGIHQVYRPGGDEFVVSLSGLPSPKVAPTLQGIADRLFDEVDAHKDIPTTISLGGVYLDPEQPLQVSLKQADDAMYRAKRAGDRTVEVVESGKYLL